MLNIHLAADSELHDESYSSNNTLSVLKQIGILYNEIKDNKVVQEVNKNGLLFSNKIASIFYNETDAGKSIFKLFNCVFPDKQNENDSNPSPLFKPNEQSWSFLTLVTAGWAGYPAAKLTHKGLMALGRACLPHRGKLLFLILSCTGFVGITAYDENFRKNVLEVRDYIF